eukprot:689996-Hanusia_phi.AAC.1
MAAVVARAAAPLTPLTPRSVGRDVHRDGWLRVPQLAGRASAVCLVVSRPTGPTAPTGPGGGHGVGRQTERAGAAALVASALVAVGALEADEEHS